MPFAVFLLAMVLPIAKRVLVALGISIVTYTGLSLVLSNLQSYVISSIGGMTGAASQVAAMLGFQESVGIILAAVATKFAMAQLTHWAKS